MYSIGGRVFGTATPFGRGGGTEGSALLGTGLLEGLGVFSFETGCLGVRSGLDKFEEAAGVGVLITEAAAGGGTGEETGAGAW